MVLPGQTAQIIQMVPEKEGHIIDLQWAIPPQQQLYRASPCGYLGHLLGWVANPIAAPKPEHQRHEATAECAQHSTSDQSGPQTSVWV